MTDAPEPGMKAPSDSCPYICPNVNVRRHASTAQRRMRSHLEELSVHGFEERQWAGVILLQCPLVLVAMRCAQKSARRHPSSHSVGCFLIWVGLHRSASAQKPACRCNPIRRPLTLVILPYTKRAPDAMLHRTAPDAFILGITLTASRSSKTLPFRHPRATGNAHRHLAMSSR